jgi:hypothetical protein
VTDQVAEVERLVAELRATGTMSAEQIADIERFVADAKAGTLWADDLTYLTALHAKVTGAPAPETDEEHPAPVVTDAKFEEIRRRFVERYHPETGTDNDRSVRERVYGDFWKEFEAVDAGR